jgi:hypothetical protein
VQGLDEPADLVALTQACRVDRRNKPRNPGGARVERALLGAGAAPVGGLGGVDLALEGDGPVRCQNLVDVLPARALGGGEYAFEAWIAAPDDAQAPRERVRFFVGPAASPVAGSEPSSAPRARPGASAPVP